MSKFLTLIKYSDPAFNALRNTGFAKHKKELRNELSEAGVDIDGIYMSNGVDWHFVIISDHSSEISFALNNLPQMSADIENAVSFELHSAKAMDKAVELQSAMSVFDGANSQMNSTIDHAGVGSTNGLDLSDPTMDAAFLSLAENIT